MKSDLHESVLVSEVLESLHIEKGKKYIDATLGNAGHTLEILKLGGQVLGIELDPQMIEISKKRLADKAIPPSRWNLLSDRRTINSSEKF